jgi:hypothetical protein
MGRDDRGDCEMTRGRPDWFGGVNGHLSLRPGATWLERHCGSIENLLQWLAEELPACKTKPQRLELAQVLEELSFEITRRQPQKKRRGRRYRFMTWRDAALVTQVMKRAKTDQRAAERAVVGDDKTAIERVERYLRSERKSGLINYSYNELSLRAALARIPKTHRIK